MLAALRERQKECLQASLTHFFWHFPKVLRTSAAVRKTQTKYRRLRMPSQRGVFEIFSTGCGKFKEFTAKLGSCGNLWGTNYKPANLQQYNYKLQLYNKSMGFPQPSVPHGVFSRLKCNICSQYRIFGVLLPQPLSIYVRLPLGVSMSHCKRPLVLRPCFLWSYAPLRGSSKRERVTNEISSGNLTL